MTNTLLLKDIPPQTVDATERPRRRVGDAESWIGREMRDSDEGSSKRAHIEIRRTNAKSPGGVNRPGLFDTAVLVGCVRFELTTYGLRVRCSTN